ncbi:long-chain fatty acid--CoA ligase [Vibrio sinensis]|uniref:Long-chain-fatty-acid--CoA ligase n=1 Tax=Vibrio sinensis TaxID=2302434 RepID=A0A3A6R5W0_9VIBR|nr:AMP-binding protein [Vibrio sinensis]RJX72382.1 long-chain fatty acid--CoA ligase [Vibrio sinensis]
MKKETHNKIISYLHDVPRERVFLNLESSFYTFGNVFDLSQEFKSKHHELEGKNCTVISDDKESLALFLPGIDSVFSNVFLQPNDIGGDETELYQAARIDYIVRLGNHTVISVERFTEVQNVIERRKNETSYILSTSGTTGQPKLASYNLDSLTATAQKNIARGSEFIWGLSYDINRFAGLQVYLQAIVAGSELVIPSSTQRIDSLVTLFANKNVNCLSATPSFWRKVLMVPSHKLMPLKRITLGGEISNQNILTALSNSYPNTNIIHIYASTEAGVGFAVRDKKEGFPSDFLEPESGLVSQLKVESGLLWIKSRHGCTHFVRGALDVDADGFINTGDLVEVKDKRVYFLGRASGSINVGGNKVMPEKIESALEESPLVAMARVFAKKNPVLGALVATDIVPTDIGATYTNKELKAVLIEHCRKRLEAFEIPVMFRQIDSIETNATGKKVRNKK